MESGIILRHYLVAFSALLCGILSILCGGFGLRLLDKLLHLLIYIGISFESYYLQSLDMTKHKLRIVLMSVMLVAYSVLFNLWLSIFCLGQLLIFLLLSKKINSDIPDISKDSPLVFGYRTLPHWLLFFNLSYGLPLFLLM